MPRPSAVSKVNQASPPLSTPWYEMILKLAGCATASVAASIAWISAVPSLVRMFQVNATRSRQ
jgi:hypothetical protein